MDKEDKELAILGLVVGVIALGLVVALMALAIVPAIMWVGAIVLGAEPLPYWDTALVGAGVGGLIVLLRFFAAMGAEIRGSL